MFLPVSDSEAVFRRQEAMDAARRRLQEQHEAMVQKYKEEQIKVIAQTPVI